MGFGVRDSGPETQVMGFEVRYPGSETQVMGFGSETLDQKTRSWGLGSETFSQEFQGQRSLLGCPGALGFLIHIMGGWRTFGLAS